MGRGGAGGKLGAPGYLRPWPQPALRPRTSPLGTAQAARLRSEGWPGLRTPRRTKTPLPPTGQRGAVRGDSSPAAAAQGAHPLSAARRCSRAPAPPLGRSPAAGSRAPSADRTRACGSWGHSSPEHPASDPREKREPEVADLKPRLPGVRYAVVHSEEGASSNCVQ